MRNLSENTRLQGYFVCTGYDGNAVFDLLRKKKADEGVAFVVGGGKKICEIVKKYDYEGFSDDETSIGYMIHVFQETIQKTSREYLVNFRYFVRIMENYGFELISDADARLMGLPHASGLFGELFQMMEEELVMDQTRNQQYKSAPNMSSAEKQISFLNRYFVFRKVMSVDAEKKEKLFLQGASMEAAALPDVEAAFEREQRKRPALRGEIKKTKMRVRLQKPAAALFSEVTQKDAASAAAADEKDEPEKKRARE
jgi:hypothetical protein